MIDIDDLRIRLDRIRHKGVLPGTVLEVDWAEAPAEPGPGSPLEKLQRSLGGAHLDLRETIAAIDRAAEDDRIAGLVARVQFVGAPLAVCQELRAAVARFRAAGKATTAYAETVGGNAAYYVACAFERVVVLGAGELTVLGLASSTSFLGDALPNAGIEPEFLQRHEYKNMANLFTETDYTPAHREAVERLMTSTLDQLVADIAAERGLEPEAVRDAIESGPHQAPVAVERGLIDAVGFADEVWAQARETDDAEAPLQYLSRYAHHTKPKKAVTKDRPVVAVISVTGPIADGKSGFKPGIPPGQGTGSDTVVAGIRAAVADDDVEAIVLRVDSPGGSAVASEVMARAVEVARAAGTPVVASMGSVAASGGYYVSAPCDRIVANPGTITGSIGVVAGKFVTSGLRDKARIATRTIASSDNATLYSSTQPFTEEHRASLDASLDRTYELFLDRVATGRDMTRDEVHEVAKGRVWTGSDAHERGLVDRLGGFRDAVAEAKALAGIAEDAPVTVRSYPVSSPLDFLDKRENSEPVGAIVLGLAGSLVARALTEWERQLAPTGVQLRAHGDWRLR